MTTYRRPLLLLLVLCVTLLTAACGGKSGELVLRDSFDVYDSLWGEDTRDEFTRGFADDAYFFEIIEPQWLAWALSTDTLRDADIETDAYLSDGPTDNHFGVICRYRSPDDFYYLAISSDGFHAIFRRQDGGDLKPLNDEGAMLFSPAIKTGNEPNRIRALCHEDELTLFVNGELLDSITDDAHSRGHVGFAAGSGPDGGVRIQFDEFAVYRP
jgi:hypothetical protein